jgi:hypothetical protein
VTGVILHALVHVAEQLDEDGLAALFSRVQPEFWAMIRRLSLLSGQIEKQLAAGADLHRVIGGMRPVDPHQASQLYYQRLLNLDALTQLSPCVVRGLTTAGDKMLPLFPSSPN